MLGQAIGDLLPTAIVVALSPIPIVAVILMLGTPRARSNGLAFAIGWILALAVVCTVVLVVLGNASDPDSTKSDSVNWVTLGFGLLLLSMAARQWRSRPRHGETPEMPKWMSTVDAFTAGKSFVLGVVLAAVNPKNLVLTLAAAGSIAQAGLSDGDAAIAVVVFVAIASITVAGSAAFYLVAPKAAAKPLDGMRDFMATHNAVIMCVVLLVIAAKLIGDGLGGVTL